MEPTGYNQPSSCVEFIYVLTQVTFVELHIQLNQWNLAKQLSPYDCLREDVIIAGLYKRTLEIEIQACRSTLQHAISRHLLIFQAKLVMLMS